MYENTAIITSNTTTTTNNNSLKIRKVEIDPATGEAGARIDGIRDALIAANINALGVELLAESCRRQKPLEVGDMGERFGIAEAERCLKTLRGHYGPQGFDFIGYFSSTSFWGCDPELAEIMEEICHRETPLWCTWETGRLGYISLDRDKAQLVSVAPRRIARDELRATTTAARVAPRAFLSSLLRDLTAFGPEATWLEDQARVEWAALEGNPLKPGKLLRKLIRGMEENWYISKAEELANRIKQRFSLVDQIKVSHDLETVYDMESIFTSCMIGKGHLYRGLVNAVPDVEIAYLCDPGSGRLLGRALLWPEVRLSNDSSIRLMDRIYAENELVRQSFRRYAENNGYCWKTEDGHSCSHCTNGREVISLSSAYIDCSYEFRSGAWRDGAPYLDTFSEIDISDDRIFCFASRGQISCRETDGSAGWLTEPPVCNVCGLEICDDNFERFGDCIYCEDCAENLEKCIHCCSYSHPSQGGIYIEDGFLCKDCENEAQYCESCEQYFYNIQMVEVEIPEISGEICPNCLEKMEAEHDLQECSVNHCKTLILPDSPGNMCKYHRESLGKICAHCGEWVSTDKAAQFNVYWLCPDCVKLMLQNTPLNIGYHCTDCRTFRRGKPAAVCGDVVLCQDCLELRQAPDDYRPPRPAATPAATPEESPDSSLITALTEWCRRAKSAETPQETCQILGQLNARIQTDCSGDGERHQRVFFGLCGILKTFFCQSVYLRQSPHQSTILWTQYTTNNLSIEIELTHNQGNARTWLVARPI